MKPKILNSPEMKLFRSPGYNFNFFKKEGVYNGQHKKAGQFERWGAKLEDDPDFSPYGPEILDLEVSTGECLGNCPFCYKCNGSGVETQNMTLEEFKVILHKMPPTLTQIAFGITNISGNPDFFPMMAYARKMGVIPNYTCHGLDVNEEVAKQSAELCGAVAVSIVQKEKTYDTIKMFTDAGMTQVNIHYMLSEETYERAFRIADEIASDPRLAKLNAIVFLQYKPKGRHPNSFHVISDPAKYKKLVQYCENQEVGIGFDSCSAPLYFKAIEDNPNREYLAMYAEPCEAFGMFSSYINASGVYYPCSFCEGEEGWEEGLDVAGCDNFLKDIWHHTKLKEWREIILNSSCNCSCEFATICRSCPVFDVTACKRQNNA